MEGIAGQRLSPAKNFNVISKNPTTDNVGIIHRALMI